MNFQMWKGELEIFDEKQVLEQSDEAMLHAWMTGDKRLTFVLGKDCELQQVTHEGKIYYSVVRKEDDA